MYNMYKFLNIYEIFKYFNYNENITIFLLQYKLFIFISVINFY